MQLSHEFRTWDTQICTLCLYLTTVLIDFEFFLGQGLRPGIYRNKNKYLFPKQQSCAWSGLVGGSRLCLWHRELILKLYTLCFCPHEPHCPSVTLICCGVNNLLRPTGPITHITTNWEYTPNIWRNIFKDMQTHFDMADKDVFVNTYMKQMRNEWSTNLALSTVNLFSIFCCFLYISYSIRPRPIPCDNPITAPITFHEWSPPLPSYPKNICSVNA